MANRKDTLAALAKLMEKIDVGMLTTIGPQGHLVSRPLSTQDVAFDGERVWFFTSARSPKVGEIRRNAKVNLAYASKDRNTYISAAGEASINRDQARIDLYWNDAMKAFFPKGRHDPDLTLIEVALRSIEYWDGPSSWIGKAITFVAARVTGNDDLMGENRIVDVATGRSRKAPGSDTGAGTRASSQRKVAGTLNRTAVRKPAAKKKAAGSAKAAPRKAAKRKAVAKTRTLKRQTARVRKATVTGAAPTKAIAKRASKAKAGTPAKAAAKRSPASARARGQAEAQRRTRQR